MPNKPESRPLRNPADKIVFSERAATKVVRVPCNLIGRLLDNGKASAHALKLLAIKVSKGDGFVLNETYVQGRYNMNHKPFRSGIQLLKQTGVLDRSQPNHRAYAVEKVAAKVGNFVMIEEALLYKKKAVNLLAFIMAVNVSMEPGLPIDFAKRVGITSRGTAYRLAMEARQYGCDIRVGTGSQPMMIGRGGLEFEQLFKKGLSKKGLSKNGLTHSTCKKGTTDERRTQNLAAASYATPNPDGFGGMMLQEDFRDRQIILTSWKRSAFWRERELLADGVPDMSDIDIDKWKRHVGNYGGAPDHLLTMHSFRQVAEVVAELAAIMGETDVSFVLQAFAYWTCRAHADGRRIRSLGFIAAPLAHQCDMGDTDWCFNYPSPMPDGDYEIVAGFARKAVLAAEAGEIPLAEESLQSTQGLEELRDHMLRHGQEVVVAAVNHIIASGVKPREGYRICRWSWFTQSIQVEQPKRSRR